MTESREDGGSTISVTRPCSDYLVASSDLVQFIGFVTQLAMSLDAAAAAPRLEVDPQEFEAGTSLGGTLRQGAPDDAATERLAAHARTISEVMLTRAVDNLQTYLSGLLSLIFTWGPETLQSEGMVPVSEVLGYETREELIEALADRKVESLAYQGMRKLNARMSKELGLPLFVDEDSLERAVRLVATRNAIVHNRGLASRKYLRDTGGPSDALGEFIWIGDVYMQIDSLTVRCWQSMAAPKPNSGLRRLRSGRSRRIFPAGGTSLSSSRADGAPASLL
jgi:hypothetical protein